MTTVINSPTPAATPVEPAPVVDAVERPNGIGLIALGIAIVGFLLAVFAVTAGFAWMLLVPAIILAVVALIRPRRRKGAALAALIIAVVGLILSFIGFRLPSTVAESVAPLNNAGGFTTGGTFFGSTGTAGAPGAAGQPGGAGTPGGSSGGSSTPAPGGGDTLVDTGGVAVDAGAGGVNVDVKSVDCTLPLVDLLNQLCVIHVGVTNDSGSPLDLDSTDITAYAGGKGYTGDPSLGDGILAQVVPGGSADGLVYVKVPVGTVIDNVGIN